MEGEKTDGARLKYTAFVEGRERHQTGQSLMPQRGRCYGSGSTGNGGSNGHSGKTVTINGTTITVTGGRGHIGPVSGSYDNNNHTATIGLDSSQKGIGYEVSVQFGKAAYGVGQFSDCGVHNAVCHGSSGAASGSK